MSLFARTLYQNIPAGHGYPNEKKKKKILAKGLSEVYQIITTPVESESESKLTSG